MTTTVSARSRPRASWIVGALVVALVAATWLMSAFGGTGATKAESSVPAGGVTDDSATGTDGAGADDATPDITGTDSEPATGTGGEPQPEPDPVRIEIPVIGVDAEIIEVSLEPDGAMEVPDFGLAGWYAPGPAPGAPGPAVIAAHVDSRAGPDVFFRLRELEPGDEVHVHRADGTTVAFTVSGSEHQDKDELPVDRIWNPTEDPVLRLITCGGEFDRAARSYKSNVIVYAELASSTTNR